MTHRPDEDDLHALVSRVLERDIGPLAPDDGLDRALGIDSIDLLRLVAAVEERYEIRIPDDDLMALRSYGDLLALLDIDTAEATS